MAVFSKRKIHTFNVFCDDNFHIVEWNIADRQIAEFIEKDILPTYPYCQPVILSNLIYRSDPFHLERVVTAMTMQCQVRLV
jgi:hypothetical protein